MQRHEYAGCRYDCIALARTRIYSALAEMIDNANIFFSLYKFTTTRVCVSVLYIHIIAQIESVRTRCMETESTVAKIKHQWRREYTANRKHGLIIF